MVDMVPLPRRILLACDLDDTVAGDTEGERRFTTAVKLARDAGVLVLAYVTGRYLASGQRLVAQLGLPEPDWWGCDSGASLYQVVDGEAIELTGELSQGQWDAEQVRSRLSGHPALVPQDFDNVRRVSYIVTNVEPQSVVQEVRGALVGLDVSVALIKGNGLDVLPVGCDKGVAVAFIAEHEGIPAGNVLVVGDSENDVPMLTGGFGRAVIVGNAEPHVKEALKNEGVIVESATHGTAVADALESFISERGFAPSPTKSY